MAKIDPAHVSDDVKSLNPELFGNDTKEVKKNKYGAKRTEVDGHKFDSMVEAKRYRQLKILEMLGEIKDLVLQPQFTLIEGFSDGQGDYVSPVTYRADFMYEDKDGITHIEDVKGTPTMRRRDFIIVFKFMKYLYRNEPNVRVSAVQP